MNFIKEVSVDGGKTVNLVNDSGTPGDYYIQIENGSGDYHVTISK